MLNIQSPGRRRFLGGLASLIAVASVSVAIISAAPPSTAQGTSITTGGYDFTNISVGVQPDPVTGASLPGHARVYFSIGWTNDFPGQHQCEWKVYDSTGTEIGSNFSTITALDPVPDDVFYEDINVVGEPDSASVHCQANRLDDPQGEFTINNVKIARGLGLPGRATVEFDYQWNGSGSPSAQDCRVIVRGASGALLIDQTVNFATTSSQGNGSEFNLRLPEELKEKPASASVSCLPLDSNS